MKQLDRLLFLQGQRCFFCGVVIPLGEASVEHLVATSNGGSKSDENCVVCCKAVNLALGHLSVKAKLQAVLNQRNGFVCPAATGKEGASLLLHSGDEARRERIALIVSDLQKRGSARPRRVATLRNTINAAFQMSLSEADLDELVAELKDRGYVVVEGAKVSYALPLSGA